eukprot:jgi/Botrbrau1/17549/Bobra.0766s0005.1
MQDESWIFGTGPVCTFWRRMYFAAKSGDLARLEEVRPEQRASAMPLQLRKCNPGKYHLWQPLGVVAQVAAGEGHLACLEALLGWFGPRLPLGELASAAAGRGHLECLQALHKAGCKKWGQAAQKAALNAHAACLRYILELQERSQPLGDFRELRKLQKSAIRGGLECVKVLHEAGCKWGRTTPAEAASQAKPQILQYLLEVAGVEPWSWTDVMEQAVEGDSPECMEMLYHLDYRQKTEDERSFRDDRTIRRTYIGWGEWEVKEAEPEALHAVRCRKWRCAEVAFERSCAVDGGFRTLSIPGSRIQPPKDEKMRAEYISWAVAGYRWTTAAAALSGDLRGMQYPCKYGAKLYWSTLKAAVAGDSLECLRFAHESGCPYEYRDYEGSDPDRYEWSEDEFEDISEEWEKKECEEEDWEEEDWEEEGWEDEECDESDEESGRRSFKRKREEEEACSTVEAEMPVSATAACSLPVLQYVCDHMDPMWAAAVVKKTAVRLEYWAKKYGEEVDWQLVLYLARKLGQPLPPRLHKIAAVRRGRAAALAGCVFKAGKLAREQVSDPSGALWAAVAQVPCELWLKIAVHAHLVIA